MLPNSITTLIAALAKLPGIGPRSAERVALHIGAQIPLGEEGEFAPPEENFDVSAGAKSTNLARFVPAATLNAWARYSF